MALLERTALLDELCRLARAARDGTGGMVLLGGEAGVGKTALVRALAEALPDGMRRWEGTCDPLEHPIPLAPLLGIGREEPAVRRLMELAPAEVAPRVVRLLRTPTVLVVEDAHWMDEATGDLFTYLARRVERTSALVVVTYRDTEPGAATLRRFLGAVGTAAGVRHRRLSPLSPQAVDRLAAGGPMDAGELYRRTGGNPFYVTEVLAEPGRSVPTSVACAVLSRADRLGAEAREFLDLVSLAPDGLEMEVVERVLGTERTQPALDEVTGQEMVSLQGARLYFRHELARSAVADALPPQRSTDLHTRLLDALQDRPGVEPARLVHHASVVGDTARLRRYAPAAAELAYRRGAYRTTIAHLESVLSLEELGVVEEAELLDLWSDCRWQLDAPSLMRGHRARTATAWQRAGRPAKQARQLVLLASAHYRCGDLDAALSTLARARELVQDLMLDPDVGCVTAGEATAAAAFGAVPTALDVAEKAVLELESINAYEPLVPTLAVRASLRFLAGDMAAGLADGWHCLELARVHAPQLVIQEGLNVVAGLLACRQVAQADRLITALGPEIEQREEQVNRSLLGVLRARIHLQRGELNAVGAELGGVLTPYREPAVELERATIRGLCHGRTGVSDAAEVLASAAREAAALGGQSRLWPVAAARAELAWLTEADGRVEEITEDALEAARLAQHPWAAGELLHWRWRCGYDDGPPPEWVAAPWRLMLTGRWAEAAQAWEELGAPYERALALASGDAAARLRALETLERMGARPVADRVRADLRRAGLTSLPSRPRNPGGVLTARQREVLALMAEGLTNVQIARRLSISAKTAGHHVSAVLARLGAASRAEAVAAALRDGTLPDPERPESTHA